MNEDLGQRIQAIYHNYHQDVYYFLLLFTGNQNDAEDLTQEVFVRLLRALPSYDGRVPIKTWLISIAKHAAIDQYRKQKILDFFSDNWLKRITSQRGQPEKALVHKEDAADLKRAIMQLKPHHRMVVILRCIEDYSVKETAELLQISEAKVKVDYHRALKKLQKGMEELTEGGWQSELAK